MDRITLTNLHMAAVIAMFCVTASCESSGNKNASSDGEHFVEIAEHGPLTPGWQFTTVQTCSEIPGSPDRLKNVSIGTSLGLVKAILPQLPTMSSQHSIMWAPSNWGAFFIYQDALSETRLYFFHDSKFITKIAYAQQPLTFGAHLSSGYTPLQIEPFREPERGLYANPIKSPPE